MGTLLNTSAPHDGEITATYGSLISLLTHVGAPRRCACRRPSREASFPVPGRAASTGRGACPASLKTGGEGMMSTCLSKRSMSCHCARKPRHPPATIDTSTNTSMGANPPSDKCGREPSTYIPDPACTPLPVGDSRNDRQVIPSAARRGAEGRRCGARETAAGQWASTGKDRPTWR